VHKKSSRCRSGCLASKSGAKVIIIFETNKIVQPKIFFARFFVFSEKKPYFCAN